MFKYKGKIMDGREGEKVGELEDGVTYEHDQQITCDSRGL